MPSDLTLEPLGDTSIVLHRTFAAPPERVFRAFTDPEQIMRWMGTGAHPLTACTVDLTVGGALRYEWGPMGLSGHYEAIDAPHRLVHVERFDEDWTGGDARVETDFEDLGGMTRVRMVITYTSQAARDAVVASPMQQGMAAGYLVLDDFLAHRLELSEVDPELDLLFERIVPVSPERVWRAWTDAEQLVKWFTPAPWRTTSARVEAVPGGAFDTVMEGPEGERHEGRGCVLVAEPNRLLVWTDAMTRGFRPSAESFMTGILQLTPHPEGTQYRAMVRHSDAAARERHEQMGFAEGWAAAAEQLVALVTDD